MWKILVVDDNPSNRELLIAVLDGHAQCEPAMNGREAMEKYQQARTNGSAYDIILLDIAMPEVDGLEFLKYVRKAESVSGILVSEGVPVIMVTAHEKHFMQAFNNGCDDYILKPIDGNILLQKISVKLAGRYRKNTKK